MNGFQLREIMDRYEWSAYIAKYGEAKVRWLGALSQMDASKYRGYEVVYGCRFGGPDITSIGYLVKKKPGGSVSRSECAGSVSIR